MEERPLPKRARGTLSANSMPSGGWRETGGRSGNQVDRARERVGGATPFLSKHRANPLPRGYALAEHGPSRIVCGSCSVAERWPSG
jgi:hypothetical protein